MPGVVGLCYVLRPPPPCMAGGHNKSFLPGDEFTFSRVHELMYSSEAESDYI